MERLHILLGNYWWCLEYTPGECKLARFVFSRTGMVLTDSFTGSLQGCRQYLASHNGSQDGLLVADDSLPMRLLSGMEYSLQSTDSNAPFLPGVRMADLHVLNGNTPEEPVAIGLEKSCEALLDTLASHELNVARALPMGLLYASLIPVNPDCVAEAFVRITKDFSEVLLYHAGEFKGGHRIAGGIDRLHSFFHEYLPSRFPGADMPVLYLLPGSPLASAEIEKCLCIAIKECPLPSPGIGKIPAEFAALAFLARETQVLGVDSAPSLGQRNDCAPSQRRRDALLLRQTVKLSTWGIGLACAALILLGIVAAGYGLYTQSDRAEYARKRDLNQEMQAMSQNLERQRDAMAELLRHRTRRSSKMSRLIQNLPAGIWLTRWEIQGARYSLQGLALASEDISTLLATLEKAPEFGQVRLRTTERTTWQGRPAVRFDMAAEERE